MVRNERAFDLILWGATGFTGRLVAQYLADQYAPADLRWAIAGRDRDRLNELRQQIGKGHSEWAQLPIRIADARNAGQLNDLAEQTDVLCSTVGPYAKYGTPMVEACVDQKTDYCDLTGEIPWMRQMIDRFHDTACQQGTRIVHSCGFDAIPSDIGTLMVQRKAEDTFGTTCQTVRGFVEVQGGQVSGGTAASMLRMTEEASRDRRIQRLLNDPYSLVPNRRDTRDPDGRYQSPGYDQWIKQWTVPAVMERLDRSVVHRSNELLGLTDGQPFEFREYTPCGRGFTGAAVASMAAIAFVGIEQLLSVSSFREILKRVVLPAPGEGPTRSEMENGRFRMTIIGQGQRSDSGSPFSVRGTVESNRDPGYGSTARMLGEAAMSLVVDEDKHGRDGGILTPASAFGTGLINRLHGKGMSWSVSTQAGHHEMDPDYWQAG